MSGMWRPFSESEVDNLNSLSDVDDPMAMDHLSCNGADDDVGNVPNISEGFRYKRLSEDAQQIILNVYNGLLSMYPTKRGVMKKTEELTMVSSNIYFNFKKLMCLFVT